MNVLAPNHSSFFTFVSWWLCGKMPFKQTVRQITDATNRFRQPMGR